jgi:hypothetical protein
MIIMMATVVAGDMASLLPTSIWAVASSGGGFVVVQQDSEADGECGKGHGLSRWGRRGDTAPVPNGQVRGAAEHASGCEIGDCRAGGVSGPPVLWRGAAA